MMHYQITASIVLYRNDAATVANAIKSFLSNHKRSQLFLIDNSPTDCLQTELRDYLCNSHVCYMHSSRNIGFGAGHNIAIKQSLDKAPYHLVLNPDIEFNGDVIDKMFDFMELNRDVGQLLPNVCYKDGQIQKHCKLLPTPFDLIGRRFFQKSEWARKRNGHYELESFTYDQCINLPNLCGCFMFLRTACLKKIGLFDTRFFMYLEDVDLTRRMHKIARTLFYPFVSIVHHYQRGSYSNIKLLSYHIVSAVKYFFKWGWITDTERDELNNRVLSQVNTGNYENHSISPLTSNNPLQASA